MRPGQPGGLGTCPLALRSSRTPACTVGRATCPRPPAALRTRPHASCCVPPLPRQCGEGEHGVCAGGMCAKNPDMIAEPTHLGVEEDRERAAEMEDGLGMDLRDPRFGHIEDLPDFLHGELLVIVQGNHLFFLLGQSIDRLG